MQPKLSIYLIGGKRDSTLHVFAINEDLYQQLSKLNNNNNKKPLLLSVGA